MISDKIVHINFEKQEELTSTFLRFAEHYESSMEEIRGKKFTLEYFKEQYIKFTGKSEFTYYTDWGGYNIRSKELEPFKTGLFDPLSEQEISLLKALEDMSGEFYIIGTFGTPDDKRYALDHEMVHALYAIYPEYRDGANAIMSKYEFPGIIFKLKSIGYCDDIMRDEVNAYLICEEDWLNRKEVLYNVEAAKELQKYKNDFMEKLNEKA